MKQLNLLAFALVMMITFAPPAKAQEKPTATLTMLTDEIDPAYSIICVSDSGKYLGASSAEPGYICIFNTETKKTTYINEKGKLGIRINSITDDGMIVGGYGIDAMMYSPAIWKDGKWTILPVPQGMDYAGAACAISAKKDIITGWLLGGPMGEACIWRLINGKYELEILSGSKDWNDETPSWITAYDISADGKTVTGAMCDANGAYYLPCAWTRDDNGQYGGIKLYGMEICFNLNETKPGSIPVYNDYVTAPNDTPEQAEQIAQFNEAYDNWQKLNQKYVTRKYVNGRPSFVSANGKYFVASMQSPNSNPSSWERNQSAACQINMTDGTTTVFKNTTANGAFLELTGGYASTDDGITFAVSPNKGRIAQTWIYTDKDSSPLEFYKWMNSEYGMETSLFPSFNYQPEPGITVEDTIITGTPYISSDQSMIAFTLQNPETGSDYVNYYIKINKPSAIHTNSKENQISLYASKRSLHITGDADRISISDMSGKTVYQSNVVEKEVNVSHLPKGVYLIKLSTTNDNRIFKVALAD